MSYESNHPLFKSLSDEEEKEFREGARSDYVPMTKINPVWHPVYRDECNKINDEQLKGEVETIKKQNEEFFGKEF